MPHITWIFDDRLWPCIDARVSAFTLGYTVSGLSYTPFIRWFTTVCFLLCVLASVLGVAVSTSELNPEWLSLIELPLFEDSSVVNALDALVFILLTCLLIRLIGDLLRAITHPLVPRVIALPNKELLFDHGSRAPPHSC